MKNPLQEKKKRKNQNRVKVNPNPSPNLLDYQIFHPSFVETHYERIKMSMIYAIAIMQVLFIVVVLLNLIINKKIEKSQFEIRNLENSLIEKNDIYKQSRILSKKIDIYKNASAQRNLLHKKLQVVFRDLPPNVIISNLVVDNSDRSSFRFGLDVPDALSAALSLSRWSSREEVDSVILTGATLDTTTNIYRIDINLILK